VFPLTPSELIIIGPSLSSLTTLPPPTSNEWISSLSSFAAAALSYSIASGRAADLSGAGVWEGVGDSGWSSGEGMLFRRRVVTSGMWTSAPGLNADYVAGWTRKFGDLPAPLLDVIQVQVGMLVDGTCKVAATPLTASHFHNTVHAWNPRNRNRS
jgi:hypothetical protein